MPGRAYALRHGRVAAAEEVGQLVQPSDQLPNLWIGRIGAGCPQSLGSPVQFRPLHLQPIVRGRTERRGPFGHSSQLVAIEMTTQHRCVGAPGPADRRQHVEERVYVRLSMSREFVPDP